MAFIKNIQNGSTKTNIQRLPWIFLDVSRYQESRRIQDVIRCSNMPDLFPKDWESLEVCTPLRNSLSTDDGNDDIIKSSCYVILSACGMHSLQLFSPHTSRSITFYNLWVYIAYKHNSFLHKLHEAGNALANLLCLFRCRKVPIVSLTTYHQVGCQPV